MTPTWSDPLVFLHVVPQGDGGIGGHLWHAALDLRLQPHVTLSVMSKELLDDLNLLPCRVRDDGRTIENSA